MMEYYIGKKCKMGHEIKILKSNAGYYIGTYDEDGLPNCRISNGYSKEKENTKNLSERFCAENRYCNKNLGCLI